MYLALAEVFAVLIFCSSPFFLNTFVTLFYVAVRIPCVITFLAFFSRLCCRAVSSRPQWSVSRDATVVAGSSATFRCHINSGRVCWTYISQSDFILDICRKGWRDQFTGRCGVTPPSTNRPHTLTITNVRPSDAGIYICGDCHTAKGAARLLVIGRSLGRKAYHRTKPTMSYIRIPFMLR